MMIPSRGGDLDLCLDELVLAQATPLVGVSLPVPLNHPRPQTISSTTITVDGRTLL